MRSGHLGHRPRLHAPDPLDLNERDAWGDTWRVVLVRTAGCFGRVPAELVTLDPARVRCHRCRLYLRGHPQYYNHLAAIVGGSTLDEAITPRIG